MKTKKLRDDIVLVTFPDKFELCFTFFRIQEFYESPNRKLRAKYFDYETAIAEYVKTSCKDRDNRVFTYFSDWSGFNIPGEVVDRFAFLFGTKADLTRRESELLLKVHTRVNTKRFYLIGAIEGEEDVIKHELAHAFYYLSKEYRDEMKSLIDRDNPMIKDVCKHLLSIGYCKEVLDDEIQAYLGTGIRENMISKKNRNYEYLWKFKSAFNRFYNNEVKVDKRT